MRRAKPVLSHEFWGDLEHCLVFEFFEAIQVRVRSEEYEKAAKAMTSRTIDQIVDLVEKHGLSDEFWDSVELATLDAQEHE